MGREDLNDPKTKPQRDRFVEKARELDCDEDEDHFNETLRRIARPGQKKPADDD